MKWKHFVQCEGHDDTCGLFISYVQLSALIFSPSNMPKGILQDRLNIQAAKMCMVHTRSCKYDSLYTSIQGGIRSSTVLQELSCAGHSDQIMVLTLSYHKKT